MFAKYSEGLKYQILLLQQFLPSVSFVQHNGHFMVLFMKSASYHQTLYHTSLKFICFAAIHKGEEIKIRKGTGRRQNT